MSIYPQKLFNNKIIVKELPRKDQEINGIIIDSAVNAELLEGEVMATCETLKDLNGDIAVNVGDTVLFPKGVGVPQLFGSTPCLWIAAHEIWAIV